MRTPDQGREADRARTSQAGNHGWTRWRVWPPCPADRLPDDGGVPEAGCEGAGDHERVGLTAQRRHPTRTRAGCARRACRMVRRHCGFAWRCGT